MMISILVRTGPCWMSLRESFCLRMTGRTWINLFLPLEIEAVIHSLPNNKSLEPDVLPGEWYKTYADLLVSKLHQLFAHCLEAGRLPDSMYQAQIVLLPNPGKDLTCCSSYRPISLMNYDFKILAKVLANRIMKVLPSLNNIDQTGSMPGKSTDINIQ